MLQPRNSGANQEVPRMPCRHKPPFRFVLFLQAPSISSPVTCRRSASSTSTHQ